MSIGKPELCFPKEEESVLDTEGEKDSDSPNRKRCKTSLDEKSDKEQSETLKVDKKDDAEASAAGETLLPVELLDGRIVFLPSSLLKGMMEGTQQSVTA